MKRKILLSLFILAPLASFAQSQNADDIFDYIFSLFRVALNFLLPLAMAFFFYNLIKFIKASNGGQTDLAKSKDMLIWSGIALFMMVGIWSVVAYVQSSLGVRLESNITQTPILPESVR